MKKIIILIIVIFVVLFLVIFVVLFLYSNQSLVVKRHFALLIPFDEKGWNANDYLIRKENRPGMARDLIKNKKLIGKHCDEIKKLLNTYSYQKCDKGELEFNLIEFQGFGLIGFHPFAREYLKIHFNENKKVEKAEIKLRRVSG